MPDYQFRLSYLLIFAFPLLVTFGCARNQGTNIDLLALETQRYQAIVQSDIEFLDTLLDDRLIFTHASGKVDNKDSFFGSLTSGNLDYRTIDIEDAEVRMYESCGVVTGKSHLEINVRGEDRRLSLRFTTVWVQQGNDWKVVAYQSTLIPQT